MGGFVTAVGHLNIDLIYGRMPRIPAEGEEVFSESLDLQLGGGPAATLINLHRLGVRTRLGTYLGRDLLSEFARRELESHGIPFVNLYRGDLSPLTVTSIISTARDRTFVSHAFDDEGYAIPESDLYELYRGCSVAYIPLGYDDVWRRLKREGAVIVLDSHWREDLSLALYEEAFGYVDYFTPNQKEAQRITGEADPYRSVEVLAGRVAGAVVKLGAEGCLFREGGATRLAPALRDFGNVDATGAGDAFLSGFILGILEGRDLGGAVRLGNIAGAKCVGGVGCLSSWCGREELMALYARESARP